MPDSGVADGGRDPTTTTTPPCHTPFYLYVLYSDIFAQTYVISLRSE